MKLRNRLLPFSISLVLLTSSGCIMSGHKSEGLNKVDDLLGRIERLYVDGELAEASVREALEAMEFLSEDQPGGDPLELHKSLASAVERSQKQSHRLQKSLQGMKRSGEALFERWTADLAEFRSESMRTRSAERLTETRGRYDAIVNMAEPVAARIEDFNAGLSDAVLFLSNDFNPDSIAALQAEMTVWSEQALEIALQLDRCLTAAEAYLRSSALPDRQSATDELTAGLAQRR